MTSRKTRLERKERAKIYRKLRLMTGVNDFLPKDTKTAKEAIRKLNWSGTPES